MLGSVHSRVLRIILSRDHKILLNFVFKFRAIVEQFSYWIIFVKSDCFTFDRKYLQLKAIG